MYNSKHPPAAAVGYYFNKDLTLVNLIKKVKPASMSGKLNGIGGKLEWGETPVQAMVREFWEEAGVQTKEEDWKQFLTIELNNYKVNCFAAIGDTTKPQTMTIEPVAIYSVNALLTLRAEEAQLMVYHVSWSLAMAREFLRTSNAKAYRAVENCEIS